MRVEVLLFDGVDELDALGPYEVLARQPELDVALVALRPDRVITASHGAQIQPQDSLSAAPDLLIVPGGGWNSHAPQGARAEAARGEIPEAIARRHAAGTTVASVCTGAMLVAAAGLLRGRPAVTHHGALDELRASGASVMDARVVDDGDILSAGGITSGLDLALWLVEREVGAEAATQAAAELEHERRGPIWRSERAGAG